MRINLSTPCCSIIARLCRRSICSHPKIIVLWSIIGDGLCYIGSIILCTIHDTLFCRSTYSNGILNCKLRASNLSWNSWYFKVENKFYIIYRDAKYALAIMWIHLPTSVVYVVSGSVLHENIFYKLCHTDSRRTVGWKMGVLTLRTIMLRIHGCVEFFSNIHIYSKSCVGGKLCVLVWNYNLISLK